ncbi:hypothetical protein QVD17_03102 [Tagetes erecta]|uniref:C2H2-type domain-containing protein n=1 Tax=Tagetes erecta TaxID=13708 RepID=A0AAD8P9Q2_TARER|nr:hypothetical protein QVD17_03102 [Tagetes erecta]
MESITMSDQEDVPTNTIQEDHEDQDHVAPGSRSYECIFCKRGLTSAQALGGHMNIHRKHRAKSSPNCLSNNNSNKQEDINSSYAYPRFYHPVFTSFPNHQEGNVRHTTSYASSTSSVMQHTNHGSDHQDAHGAIMGSSEENMTTISQGRLNVFSWSGEDNKGSKRRNLSGSKEDELDLELRLGHDP